MKVVNAQEMGRIEKLAYEQGASEEDFMEEAGCGVAELAQRIIAKHHLKPKILLLCGGGNNAGDAYVAGRILRDGGFHVNALAISPHEKSSRLCQLQSQKFLASGGVIDYIEDPQKISFGDAELLIDGILGTGFHGEVHGLFRELILRANASNIPILAIDIPSGVNGTTGEIGSVAIKSLETLFLGLPKTGCFLGDVWNEMGKVHVHDFGLGQNFIDEAKEDFELIDDLWISEHLPRIKRTRHKYQAGYVVGVGGSKNMPGAPIMASYAALRSGAGMVRLLHPEGMESELAAAPFELIRQSFSDADVNTILEAANKASAMFVGPGLGLGSLQVKLLKRLLPKIQKPCVIDADALTIIAQHEISLPPQTILTPHQGEMKRLLHHEDELNVRQLHQLVQEYADKRRVTLVLKGAPTFIFHPDRKPFICPRGDPGMATAGSGDVLTGIISGFLAQIQDPLQATILGVYFHALAGEYAAEEFTSFCMVASDITNALPWVFFDYLPV